MKLNFGLIVFLVFFVLLSKVDVFGQSTSITIIDQNSKKGIAFA